MIVDEKTVSKRFLLSSAAFGALAYGLLFAWFWLTSEFGFMGQESGEIRAMVEEHYVTGYLLFNLELLGYSLLLGGLVGIVSGLMATGLSGKVSGCRARTAIACVAVSLLVVMRSVLLTPQLYWEVYAEPGVTRTLIDLLIDHVPLGWVHLGLAVSTLLSLLGARRVAGWCAATTLLVLVLLAGWRVQTPVSLPPGVPQAKNVILIMVDSLRSDRLSSLGYSRRTTPQIDRLTERADTFVNSYVSLPRTMPSVLSLMTGELPYQHGVRTMFPPAEERLKVRTALPRLFKEKGYATAVVSDYAGEMFRDVDLGFDHVETPSFNFPAVYRQRSLETQFLLLAWLNNSIGRQLLPDLDLLPQNADPELLTDRALKLVATLPEPFFLTVFYSATHFPYTATYPDYLGFSDKDYRGPYRIAVSYLHANGEDPSPEDREQVSALYDGALHGVDRALGRLLQRLEESGRLANSMVLLTGDHGENLYDSDSGLGHGDHFVGGLQSARVPLVFNRPEYNSPQKYFQDVRDIDLMPTLVDLFDLPRKDKNKLHGLSLYDNSASERPVYVETGLWMSPVSTKPIADRRIEYPDIVTVGEIDFAAGDEVVIKNQYRDIIRTAKHRLYKEGPWVLVYMPTRQRVTYALYRHDHDPSFTHDLAAEQPLQLQAMREKLLALMAGESGVVIKNDYLVYEDH